MGGGKGGGRARDRRQDVQLTCASCSLDFSALFKINPACLPQWRHMQALCGKDAQDQFQTRQGSIRNKKCNKSVVHPVLPYHYHNLTSSQKFTLATNPFCFTVLIIWNLSRYQKPNLDFQSKIYTTYSDKFVMRLLCPF